MKKKDSTVILDNGMKLTVSRNYKKEFLER
jgi:hypothetical protein